jgi:tetratricopeptide (TPR) repeat protein
MRTVAGLLLLLATNCPLALAQAHSFLTVTIVDEEGAPAPGVHVTVTCPEDATFREELTTDKKGRFDLAVFDGTLDYEALLEGDGYQTIRTLLNPEIGERTRLTIELPRAIASDSADGPTFSAGAEAVRLFDEGVDATKAGDLVTARKRFEAAVADSPELAPAHSALAGLYLEAGEYSSALAAANRTLELLPDDARSLRILYETHRGLGDSEAMEAARVKLERIESGSDMAALLFNEGADATKLGDYERAAVRFRDALNRDPGLTEARAALAITLYQLHRFSEAEVEAVHWLEAAPANVEALRVHYKILEAQGKTEQAQQALVAMSQSASGGDLEVQVEQAKTLFEKGEVDPAIAVLQSVIAAKPDHALAHYLLGLCFLNQGETALSREQLEKFLRLAPTHPEAASAQEMLSFL